VVVYKYSGPRGGIAA